jgi:hypothetical protein
MSVQKLLNLEKFYKFYFNYNDRDVVKIFLGETCSMAEKISKIQHADSRGFTPGPPPGPCSGPTA